MRACVLLLLLAGCATATALHGIDAKHSRRHTDFHRQFEDALATAKDDWVERGWCRGREATECDRGSIVTVSDEYEGNSWYFDANGAATGYENFGCLGWRKHGKIFRCRRSVENLCVRALSELTRVSSQIEIGDAKLDLPVGVTPFNEGGLVGTIEVQPDATLAVTLTLESDVRVLVLEDPVWWRTKGSPREVVTIERGTPIQLPVKMFAGVSDGLIVQARSRFVVAK